MMRNKDLFFMSVFLTFLLTSCASKHGVETNADNQNKNYMEGKQSPIDRNVEQLEKRRDADEIKIDVMDYKDLRPK